MNKTVVMLVLAILTFNNNAASTNYEAIYTNDDGSVTIINPKFSYPGTSKGISRNSNLDGVCRLYGFDKSMGPQAMTFNEKGDVNTVHIDINGKLNSTTAQYYPISKIACTENYPTYVTSRLADDIQFNSDNSVTLVNPYFGNEYFKERISRMSNLDGVCKMFGFESARQLSLASDEKAPVGTVNINQLGRISKFNDQYYPIATLICNDMSRDFEPSSQATFFRNDDGSISIINPTFGFGDLEKGISRNSNLNGVCQHYGYTKSVAMEFDSNANANSYEINQNGKVISSTSQYYPISLLICN